MSIHEFTIAFVDHRAFYDLRDALSAAGCSALSVGRTGEAFRLDFCCQAETIDEAFEQAITEVRSAGVTGALIVTQT